MNWKAIIAVSILALTAEAWAGPTAIIEEIGTAREDFQPMDFLDAGEKIDLKSGETLHLGYLDSCIREEIRGGTVTIGKEQSIVTGGRVTRNVLVCEGGTSIAKGKKKRDAGAVVFRANVGKSTAKPEHVVFALSPLVHLSSTPGEIRIMRLDGRGKVFRIPVEDEWVDLAKSRIKLKRNVIYRLEAGDRATTFRISPQAKSEAVLLSRLLRF